MAASARYPKRVFFSSTTKKQLIALLSTALIASAPIFYTFPACAADESPLLKGTVSETVSPFAEDGSKNELPEGLPVSLTLMANVNSEISKAGDKVAAMVSIDVKEAGKTMLPGQWFVTGTVTEVAGRRRLGRDGFLTIKFDKLVSPDGKHIVPIDVTASTKESTAKSVAKVVGKDSIYVTKGAIFGALASVQLTGIPLAIATHGYSVAGGAALGATVGLIGALKRKGNVTTALQGEELKFRLDKPVMLPAFNEAMLPSAAPPLKIENLDIVIDKATFRSDPFGDKRSKLLRVDFKMSNQTDKEYCFNNIVVVSDHNQMYYPYLLGNSLSERQKRVAPKSRGAGSITFGVSSKQQKYWLVLLDRGNEEELARVPVN